MTMRFSSLGGFAAHLLTIEADLELAREVCIEKACRMVEKEAKAAIGNYRFDWTPLKPETGHTTSLNQIGTLSLPL
jgi:hypothetical protein